MNRNDMLRKLEDTKDWDFIIIDGSANGLGTAIEDSTRGYKTLLLKQSDFAKEISNRSTKLVHGGVPYLQQGNFNLVLEAQKEQGILRNATNLVHGLPSIDSNFECWVGPFYGVPLTIKFLVICTNKKFKYDKKIFSFTDY